MSTYLFLQCFLIGLLGIAFQTILKLKLLKQKAKAANTVFKIKEFFSEDYPTIILNLITLVVCVLLFDEIVHIRPIVLEYVKFFYFFVGFTGSSILNSFLSNVNKRIMKVIDEKTDIADKKISEIHTKRVMTKIKKAKEGKSPHDKNEDQ